MKLIFCPECGDLFKLGMSMKFCDCRQSYGRYENDGLHAVIGGEGVPVGILNNSFARAYRNRPREGDGSEFTAFVIPHESKTIRYDQ